MPIIRPFLPDDASGVASTIVTIQQSEFGIPITLDDQPDLKDIEGFYQRGRGNFWVATIDAQVVGTIGLLDIGNRQCALRKMFVSPQYRGREFGVAQALLGTLLRWCRAEGVREVFLGTTDKFLAAHRFYEKNGFAEIGRAALPAAFPVMAVDSKFYALSVECEA
jgi:N-acetylglutamate synthase-like GNAT family acetyltransferase